MSPFKSESQRAKFYALKEHGKMSQATIDKWEAETPKGQKLPDRVKTQSMMRYRKVRKAKVI